MEENNNQEQAQVQNPQEEDKKSSSMVFWVIIGVVALALMGYMFFRTQNESKMTEDTSMVVEEVMQDVVSDGQAMMAEDQIAVEGGMFYFEPNELRVKLGQTVKIKFTSAGGEHDFVLDEFGVNTQIVQAGNSSEIEFTPDRLGEFEFYCSVGNHRAMGMVGKLIVEE